MFRGISGAALGVQRRIVGMPNPILGMASHDFCNAKTRVLELVRAFLSEPGSQSKISRLGVGGGKIILIFLELLEHQ